MLRIKIFEGSSIDKLEHSLNEFLKTISKQKNIMILDIKYQESGIELSPCFHYSALVMYRQFVEKVSEGENE